MEDVIKSKHGVLFSLLRALSRYLVSIPTLIFPFGLFATTSWLPHGVGLMTGVMIPLSTMLHSFTKFCLNGNRHSSVWHHYRGC